MRGSRSRERRRKGRFSRRCCSAVDEARSKEAVEFEERQIGVGLPVGSSARVEGGQKKGGARQRLEPAEAQFQFQFQLRFPLVPGLVWSGLNGWMDGRQVKTGKVWYGLQAGRW